MKRIENKSKRSSGANEKQKEQRKKISDGSFYDNIKVSTAECASFVKMSHLAKRAGTLVGDNGSYAQCVRQSRSTSIMMIDDFTD